MQRRLGVAVGHAPAVEDHVLRAELEKLGKPLAPMDLLIAVHALAEDCTLVSADRAFDQVPGLNVVVWKDEVEG